MICSFGFVSVDKAPDIIVWALKLLGDWGVAARLVFCGAAELQVAAQLKGHAEKLGIGDAVVLSHDVLTEDHYNDHMIAIDAAVQLRTHYVGSISGALSDCIEAAVPTVANLNLADAIEAPGFVRRVPDNLSPVLVAEALLEILNSGQNISRPLSEALLVAKDRSPDRYAAMTMQALGFEAQAVSNGS